jgi:hypothetical protein
MKVPELGMKVLIHSVLRLSRELPSEKINLTALMTAHPFSRSQRGDEPECSRRLPVRDREAI